MPVVTRRIHKCKYCNVAQLFDARGYGTHIRLTHPEVWAIGKVLHEGPAASWPLIGKGHAAPHPKQLTNGHDKEQDLSAQDEDSLRLPGFVLRADNPFTLVTMAYFRSLVSTHTDTVHQIDDAMRQVSEWQQQNPNLLTILGVD